MNAITTATSRGGSEITEARLRCLAARRLAEHAVDGRLDVELAFEAIVLHLEKAEWFLRMHVFTRRQRVRLAWREAKRHPSEHAEQRLCRMYDLLVDAEASARLR